jgi:hypothetical protein
MSTTRRPTRSRTPNPPNRVDPGWTHESAANLSLRLIKALAHKNGLPDINVGNIKSVDEIIPESTQEPVDLLARIFAHIGHRLPIIRSFEKRLEGKELKAGVASDSLALVIQFYSRNEQVILHDLIPTITRLIAGIKNYSVPTPQFFGKNDDEIIITPPGFFDEPERVTPNA